MGTTKADICLCFFCLSVVAKTIVALDSYALVIQALAPFITHSGPSSLSVAVVVAAPAFS